MTPQTSAIDRLADALQRWHDLDAIITLFFSEFAEDPQWDKGPEVTIKPFEKLFTELIATKCPVKNLTLLANHDRINDLLHGIVLLEHGCGTFFFLPRVDKGILMLPTPTGQLEQWRFTISVPKGTDLTDPKMTVTSAAHRIQPVDPTISH